MTQGDTEHLGLGIGHRICVLYIPARVLQGFLTALLFVSAASSTVWGAELGQLALKALRWQPTVALRVACSACIEA